MPIELLHELLSFSYGELHTMELGAAVGLLAATFYRSDRAVALVILALSAGMVVLPYVLVATPEVSQSTYRVASQPGYFLLPMVLAFAAGVRVTAAVQSWMAARPG